MLSKILVLYFKYLFFSCTYLIAQNNLLQQNFRSKAPKYLKWSEILEIAPCDISFVIFYLHFWILQNDVPISWGLIHVYANGALLLFGYFPPKTHKRMMYLRHPYFISSNLFVSILLPDQDQDQLKLLVKRRNDNHSPGPVIKELVPSPHQWSELCNTILCIFSRWDQRIGGERHSNPW